MRIRRKALLLTFAAAVSSVVVASGAWASAPLPGAGYVWAQPDASLVGVTSAESSTAPFACSMLPVGGCVWAQPGASLVGVTSTQP
jgi:hypothetical protein